MSSKYNEYKQLDLSKIGEEVGAFWKAHSVFERSVSERDGAPSFVFF